MKTYTLTIEAKKQIIKDHKINQHLNFELKNCSDSEFFGMILENK